MITDIPFHTPYSVITSHNHIKKIVQAVAITIAINTVSVLEVSMIVQPASEFNNIIIQ